jgi:anti-sigma B factor antagonist
MRDEDRPIVAARGEVDMTSAPELLDVLRSMSAAVVILDLGGVTFMDVAGVRAIAVAHENIAARNGKLVLQSVPRIPRTLLQITGLEQHLDIED